MLSGGWFTSPAGIWRRDDPMDHRVRFPIPAYLIETETERVLVDTGLNPEAAEDSAGHYGTEALGMFELELETSVAGQVDVSTLTRVVITHLHFDHAGGLALLPSSVPVFVQRREWEGAHDDETIARNFFLPADYAGITDQIVLVDGDYDLLGDGSIELLSTPGHTVGHQSVKVGDSLVLGGDVSHYASGLDDHRFPLFADDHHAQAASAERLKAMRDAGTEVTPGHDPEVLKPGPIPLA
jgi:glyoxylase-like metal-dependent hydrolase (beta-lactamase superfamily II)